MPAALRRASLAGLALLLAALSGCSVEAPAPVISAGNGPRQQALLDTLERRTFDFFWERSDPATGLTPDRWPNQTFSSIAAVGFALTAYPVGVERGYTSRADAAQRTLATLRWFWQAPQGPEPTGTSGYQGFFYHFLTMPGGTRFK